MDDKSFRDMQSYKETKYSERKTLYSQYMGKREALKKENGQDTQKEPKTAIWWMIMLFCIVYGFELLYNAMLQG
ncbi:MAG: hypothetical protein ACRCW1_03500 [Anaerotignaceae bacterium]